MLRLVLLLKVILRYSVVAGSRVMFYLEVSVSDITALVSFTMLESEQGVTVLLCST